MPDVKEVLQAAAAGTSPGNFGALLGHAMQEALLSRESKLCMRKDPSIEAIMGAAEGLRREGCLICGAPQYAQGVWHLFYWKKL